MIKAFLPLFLLSLLIQGCSVGNGFHLRNHISLPPSVRHLELQGISSEHGLAQALAEALEEAGGSQREKAPTKIIISDLQDDKRVTAFTRERKAREYLVYLKFNYALQYPDKEPETIGTIALDRSFIYDANYALGKEEELNKIRQDLQKDAARLILLRLQSIGKRK